MDEAQIGNLPKPGPMVELKQPAQQSDFPELVSSVARTSRKVDFSYIQNSVLCWQ